MELNDHVRRDLERLRRKQESLEEAYHRHVLEYEAAATKEALKELSRLGAKCQLGDVRTVELPGLSGVGLLTKNQRCVVTVNHHELHDGVFLVVDVACSSTVVGVRARSGGVFACSPGKKYGTPIRRPADLQPYLRA